MCFAVRDVWLELLALQIRLRRIQLRKQLFVLLKRPGVADFAPKPLWFSAGRLVDFYAILSAVAAAIFPLKSTLCSPLGGMRKTTVPETERVPAS